MATCRNPPCEGGVWYGPRIQDPSLGLHPNEYTEQMAWADHQNYSQRMKDYINSRPQSHIYIEDNIFKKSLKVILFLGIVYLFGRIIRFI